MRVIRLFIVLSLLLVGGWGSAHAQEPPRPIIHRDLAYADVSAAQKLDLYLPAEGQGPFPLVIYVHGGGFHSGSKATGRAAAMPVISAGYAFASLNYRLSGEAIFPAQIQDVKAAVRWLRANAETYNLNPDQFVAWGPSAGGALVALLGTAGDVAEFDDPALGNAEVSSRVQGVINWFGIVDFGVMDAQFATSAVCANRANRYDTPESPIARYLGDIPSAVPDLVAAANAITYISADDPPFLIQHGLADCVVPPAQSQLFYDMLVPVLGEDQVTLTFFEDTGHGGPAFYSADNSAIVLAFLESVFTE